MRSIRTITADYLGYMGGWYEASAWSIYILPIIGTTGVSVCVCAITSSSSLYGARISLLASKLNPNTASTCKSNCCLTVSSHTWHIRIYIYIYILATEIITHAWLWLGLSGLPLGYVQVCLDWHTGWWDGGTVSQVQSHEGISPPVMIERTHTIKQHISNIS